MIELAQQNSQGPSYFHDVYPEGSGRYGVHHVAIIVDDLEAGKRACINAGYDIIFQADAIGGVTFVMADAISTYGHLIELYQSGTTVSWFYDLVRKSTGQFEGDDIFRSLPSPT
jgi:hypothetical protein